MLDCAMCLRTISNIPLLKCGHFICNKCYNDLKSDNVEKCELCQKKLIRSCKKNK